MANIQSMTQKTTKPQYHILKVVKVTELQFDNSLQALETDWSTTFIFMNFIYDILN